MKKFAILLTIASAFTFASCESTWSSENKDLFVQGCMETAKDDGMTEDKAKEMCDCRLDKIMKKYPNFNDFLDNMMDVQNDPDIKKCWDDTH